MDTIKKIFIGVMILVGCIGLTMKANAQELSNSATALQKHKNVLEVFEYDKDVIVWVDQDLDGYCDSTILYVYIGLDNKGKRLYQMIMGTCSKATEMKELIIHKQKAKILREGI